MNSTWISLQFAIIVYWTRTCSFTSLLQIYSGSCRSSTLQLLYGLVVVRVKINWNYSYMKRWNRVLLISLYILVLKVKPFRVLQTGCIVNIKNCVLVFFNFWLVSCQACRPIFSFTCYHTRLICETSETVRLHSIIRSYNTNTYICKKHLESCNFLQIGLMNWPSHYNKLLNFNITSV
jgi:hypothetical protein